MPFDDIEVDVDYYDQRRPSGVLGVSYRPVATVKVTAGNEIYNLTAYGPPDEHEGPPLAWVKALVDAKAGTASPVT